MCIHGCVCTHISEDRKIQNKQKLQRGVLFIQFPPGLILEAFLQFLRKAAIMWYCRNIEGTYFPQSPFFNTQFKFYAWNLISFPFCHPGWRFLEETRWAMKVRPGNGIFTHAEASLPEMCTTLQECHAIVPWDETHFWKQAASLQNTSEDFPESKVYLAWWLVDTRLTSFLLFHITGAFGAPGCSWWRMVR